jgi:hypothetical protein
MRHATVGLFLFGLLLSGSVSECANILPNPGFEDWVDTAGVQMPLPWVTTAILDSAGAYRSSNAHGGSYSLALAMTESIPGAATTALLIQGGSHYDFSMYYTVSSLASAGVIVLVESDVDSNLVEHLQMLSYTPSWSQVSMGFDAHPSAVFLTILLTSLNETIFFDDGVLDGLPGTGVSERIHDLSRGESLRLTVSPNPCRTYARIVALSGGIREGRVEVYDTSGRLVRDLADLSRSSPSLEWDLRDENSCSVPSGTYFVRLIAASGCAFKRITVVR